MDNLYLCDVWIFGIVIIILMWSLVTSQCIFYIWYCTLVSIFEQLYAIYIFRLKFLLTACFHLFSDLFTRFHITVYPVTIFALDYSTSASIFHLKYKNKNNRIIFRSFSSVFQLYLGAVVASSGST